MTKNRAIAELIFAGALWGFGFIATRWAQDSFSTTWVLVLRFFIAFLIGESASLVFTRSLGNLRLLKLALCGGALLGSYMWLQTLGLEYTTVAKSGFLTCVYILFIPVILFFLHRHKSDLRMWLNLVLALIGAYYLMDGPLSGWNKGDLLTLGCALVAAFHIIWIGQVAPKIDNAFRFNNYQSLVAGFILMPLILLPGEQRVNWPPTGLAMTGIFCIAAGSSVIAFYIQVRAQRYIQATTASMLFLLEAPFALLFGWLFLQESISGGQALGAGLIILASLRQSLLEQTSPTTQSSPQ